MNIDRDVASVVSKETIVRYLMDRGWQKKVSRDGEITKLSVSDSASEQSSVNIFFSNNERDTDTSEVATAIETIGQLYDVDILEIRRSLKSLAYDLIYTRIPDEYVLHESIELGAANAYIRSMKNFLAASATTELSGERFFRRTRKEAVAYANRCRFGHTFHGSFGFVIESPVGVNNAPDLEITEPTVPFERKVMRRISNGLASFNQAVRLDDPSIIVKESNGLSSNMCDELVGIVEDTGISKFTMSVVMSPEWREVSETTSKVFNIEKRYVELLKSASTQMTKYDDPKTQSIVGRINRLETDAIPSDLFDNDASREVIIGWDSAEYGFIKVTVSLDPQGYLLALEAHRDGRIFSVNGKPIRKGRSWIVENASDARLMA